MTSPVTLANWRTPPNHRWAFHHVRELIPTAEIANDPAARLRLWEISEELTGLKVTA